MNGIAALIFILILLATGILYCFWGYRYLKVAILIYAFFSGFMFMSNLLTDVAPEMAQSTIWIISLATGVVLALLSFFFIKFAIFVAGGIGGILIYTIVRGLMPDVFGGLDTIFIFLIGLIFFIVFGAITLAAQKHLIIIFSALFGAYSFVFAAGVLIGLIIYPDALYAANMSNAVTALSPYSIFSGKDTWIMMLPVAVFTIAGIISQYRFTSKRK